MLNGLEETKAKELRNHINHLLKINGSALLDSNGKGIKLNIDFTYNFNFTYNKSNKPHNYFISFLTIYDLLNNTNNSFKFIMKENDNEKITEITNVYSNGSVKNKCSIDDFFSNFVEKHKAISKNIKNDLLESENYSSNSTAILKIILNKYNK